MHGVFPLLRWKTSRRTWRLNLSTGVHEDARGRRFLWAVQIKCTSFLICWSTDRPLGALDWVPRSVMPGRRGLREAGERCTEGIWEGYKGMREIRPSQPASCRQSKPDTILITLDIFRVSEAKESSSSLQAEITTACHSTTTYFDTITWILLVCITPQLDGYSLQ